MFVEGATECFTGLSPFFLITHLSLIYAFNIDICRCPQTIFFWAPAFKWGLVIAGLGDLQRPANKISVSQSCALGITGLIWTRYSLAITPKNWNLFSVNLFVAFTAIYQITRSLRYQQQQAALEAAKATPANASH
ncbi:hypothetical protein PUN28_008417 [Cardiocondyla obscurior]|uniref:Mitochondrial pyruvate carrier n=1 Tax=Cardiocondyla obscurior TaxID=286306 RepID=A0AAW2G0R0_9HYME